MFILPKYKFKYSFFYVVWGWGGFHYGFISFYIQNCLLLSSIAILFLMSLAKGISSTYYFYSFCSLWLIITILQLAHFKSSLLHPKIKYCMCSILYEGFFSLPTFAQCHQILKNKNCRLFLVSWM